MALGGVGQCEVKIRNIVQSNKAQEMATLNAVLSNSTVLEPVWEKEKLIPVRAIWEIAALAGDVHPSIQYVNRKKEEAPDWKAAYTDKMRRMVDALSPKDELKVGCINYDPSLPYNASILSDRKLHRQMRVDVASACEFLKNRYGIDSLPAGLTELLVHLRGNNTSIDAQSSPLVVLTTVPSKSPASRDQTKAIETKKSNLLSIVIAAMAAELWGYAVDNEDPQSLPDDVQSLLVAH